MPHRYSIGPRDGTVASFCGLVALNSHITNPDSLLGRLPTGEERLSEFKIAFEELREWEDVLMAAPGFREFVTWINIELRLSEYDPTGAEQARHELARRLRSPYHEIDTMSLADAAAVLNRPANPAGQMASTGARPDTTPPNPIDRAVELLAGSRRAVELIRFLASREGEKAHLDEIAVGIDHAPKAASIRRRKAIRQRYLRAREKLEKEGAPIALNINDHIIKLVFVDEHSGRTTSV